MGQFQPLAAGDEMWLDLLQLKDACCVITSPISDTLPTSPNLQKETRNPVD